MSDEKDNKNIWKLTPEQIEEGRRAHRKRKDDLKAQGYYLEHEVVEHALKCTTREKLDTAVKLVNGFLAREYSAVPISAWIDTVAEKENLGQENQGIEHVYRCYHQSFKVTDMAEQVIILMDVLTYLFSPEVDKDIYDRDNLYAFKRPFKSVFGDHADNIDKIFRSDSLSYRYAKDILERKPEKSGYVDYEHHHLAYMGGVFWALVCLTSALGILKHDMDGRDSDKAYLTYQRGIANYLLNTLNWQALNPGFKVRRMFDNFSQSVNDREGKLREALGKMYLRDAKRVLKGVIGDREIESIAYRVTENRNVFIPFKLKGIAQDMELFMGIIGGGWTLRIWFADKEKETTEVKPGVAVPVAGITLRIRVRSGRTYFDADLSVFRKLEEIIKNHYEGYKGVIK